MYRTCKGCRRQTSPNPLVGAIVLDKTGKVAGKGYHAKYGESHAEVCALMKQDDELKEALFT